MTEQKPWRLEDLTFESLGDDRSEKATINGIKIVRQDGRYLINSPDDQWPDLAEGEVDPVLNVLFGRRRGGASPMRVISMSGSAAIAWPCACAAHSAGERIMVATSLASAVAVSNGSAFHLRSAACTASRS